MWKADNGLFVVPVVELSRLQAGAAGRIEETPSRKPRFGREVRKTVPCHQGQCLRWLATWSRKSCKLEVIGS